MLQVFQLLLLRCEQLRGSEVDAGILLRGDERPRRGDALLQQVDELRLVGEPLLCTLLRAGLTLQVGELGS